MRKFTEGDNIGDDEIRIIGDRKSTKPRRSRWVIVPISVLIIGLIVLLSFISIKQYQPIEDRYRLGRLVREGSRRGSDEHRKQDHR